MTGAEPARGEGIGAERAGAEPRGGEGLGAERACAEGIGSEPAEAETTPARATPARATPARHTDAEGAARFARRLGLPGLVDVHTHFMPQNVLDKVWAYFDSAGPLTGRAWPITYREEEERRVALLREFGVLAFTSMLYPHKAGMAAWLNDWAADFAGRTPDCLHTATLFPEAGAPAYVRRALDRGARVFKVHLQVGDFDPNDPLLDDVWGVLEEAGTPLVVHCGSGPAPGKYTGPGPVGRLLARHPGLRLIVAHMGMPEYGDFLDLAERYDGVHLDTTMAFTDFSERLAPFPATELPRLVGLGERILFGSDFPNIPYPYLHQLHALERLGLGDDWLRGVCHDNAVRLFELGGPSRPHSQQIHREAKEGSQ